MTWSTSNKRFTLYSFPSSSFAKCLFIAASTLLDAQYSSIFIICKVTLSNSIITTQMDSSYFKCSVCNISIPIIYKGQQPPFLPGLSYFNSIFTILVTKRFSISSNNNRMTQCQFQLEVFVRTVENPAVSNLLVVSIFQRNRMYRKHAQL